MIDSKTIVLTWTDQRPWAREYGTPLAALWAAEGNDKDLNAALAYIGQHRGTDFRVHTFAPDDAEWKTKAKELHADGYSL